MLKSPKENKNRKTVKLTLTSSPKLVRRYTDVRSSDQTARISLHHPNFQRALRTQNEVAASFLASSSAVHPDCFGVSATVALSIASPRRLRFGEAISRPRRQNPQEEKTRLDADSSSNCHTPLFCWRSGHRLFAAAPRPAQGCFKHPVRQAISCAAGATRSIRRARIASDGLPGRFDPDNIQRCE